MNKGVHVAAQEDAEKAYTSGERFFLVTAERDVLHFLSSKEDVSLAAIVPDASRYVREMTQYGLVGMAMRKVRSLGIVNLLRLLKPVLRSGLKIKKKDMRVLVPLLAFVEYLELRKCSLEIMFLHYHLTDMALATGNRVLLENYLKLSVKNVRLGLMTKNLGLLDKRLGEWGLNVNTVLAPFQLSGYGMRPTQKDCEVIIKKGKRDYYGFGKVVDVEREEKYAQQIGLKEWFVSK